MNPTLEPQNQIFQLPFNNGKIKYPAWIDEEDALYPVVTEDEMGETALHFKQTTLLYNLLENFFAARRDVLVAANMSLYYDKGKPAHWLAPDVMVCFGVSNEPRRVYRTWREGAFPQVVFEIASDNTWENDIGKKLDDYNRLGAEEYYLLDPERAYLPQPLMAFQRADGELKSVPIVDYRVFSPRLGLELVDTGELVRFFDQTRQEFLLTLAESTANLEQVEAKLETTEAELETTEANLEQANAEIARLQKLLKQ